MVKSHYESRYIGDYWRFLRAMAIAYLYKPHQTPFTVKPISCTESHTLQPKPVHEVKCTNYAIHLSQTNNQRNALTQMTHFSVMQACWGRLVPSIDRLRHVCYSAWTNNSKLDCPWVSNDLKGNYCVILTPLKEMFISIYHTLCW